MTYGILLLTVLIGGAGLVAWIGDVIGRRMGKARLSLFQLRPRHTAVLVTVLTGMLIAALTLAIILVTNSTLRKMIVRGPEIIRQNRTLVRQSARLIAEQKRLDRVVREGQSEARKAQEQLTASRDQLKKANATVEELNKRISSQQSLLKAEQARVVQAREESRRADARLKQVSGRVGALLRQASSLEQRIATATVVYSKVRETPFTYNAGEEVTRGVVEPASSAAIARQRVAAVLSIASGSAAKKGASLGRNGRAVVIASKSIGVKGSGRRVSFSEKDSLEAIAQEVLSARVPVVLQVIALGNSIRGEPVPVEVKPWRNSKAFDKGDQVACTTIDPALPGEEISKQLRAFMAGPVRQSAADAGIIPRRKADGQIAYFDFEIDRLADAVSRIKAAGGTARVCALAVEDVMSAGPLELDLTVGRG